jgi:hypothetical protein
VSAPCPECGTRVAWLVTALEPEPRPWEAPAAGWLGPPSTVLYRHTPERCARAAEQA